MARQAKDVHQKHQAILSKLLKDDDNKYCVDCDAKGPRWASWNLGVFLCIRCAGIHRNLGVHISKVKSINLDSWTPEQIASVEDMGNSRARAVYEANLPDNCKRPSTSDSAMEQFIRAKYEHKKYIAKEWVPSKPRTVPSHYYDGGEPKKEAKKPVKTILKVPGAAAGTSALSRPATTEKKTPTPAAATTANKPEQSLMVDLSAPTSTGVSSSSNPQTTSADLLADIFTSAAPAPSTAASTDLFGISTAPQSAAQQSGGDTSEDLFKVADEKSQTAKDSIMALFGNAPNPPQTNMMANSYGMAPGAFAQPTQGVMPGVQPQANPAMSASYSYGYQPQMGAAATPGMGFSMAGQQPNMMAASQPGVYQQQYPGMAAMGAQATVAGNHAYMQQQMFAQQQMQMSMGNLNLNHQQVGNGMVKQATPGASFGNTPVAQTNGQTLNGTLWN